jgi:hypothetical protein
LPLSSRKRGGRRGGLGKGEGRGWDRERELGEEKEGFRSGLSKWEENVEVRGRGVK